MHTSGANNKHGLGHPALNFLGIIATCMATMLSGAMGVAYYLERGDHTRAGLTIVFELVAIAAFPAAARAWRVARLQSFVLLALLGTSVYWCGGTNLNKIQGEAAHNAEIYRGAQDQHSAAQAALDRALAETGPTCACPATITAWASAQDQRLQHLTNTRDQTREALADLDPPAPNATEFWFTFVIEFLKVSGLWAFRDAGIVPREDRMPRKQTAGLGKAALFSVTTLGLGAIAHLAPKRSPKVNAQHIQKSDVPHAAANHVRRAAMAAQAREWALQGMPKVEIARRLNVHRNTVGNWLRLR
jgi:hypothetical protein